MTFNIKEHLIDLDDNLGGSTMSLIMCKHQKHPDKIKLDMRYKVNREFVEKTKGKNDI